MRHEQTSVLILGFNRADFTIKLIEQIKNYKRYRIHLSLDGPRNFRDKVEQKKITDALPDDVVINHFQRNYGCKLAVEKGINWFFENNRFGIILEDDLEINEYGLQHLLDMQIFKHNDIFLHSACNILDAWSLYECDYNVKLPYPQIWSWATTQQQWQTYRKWELPTYRELWRSARGFTYLERLKLLHVLRQEKLMSIDTWDMRLQLYFIMKNKYSIVSAKNYVSNNDISGGTHGNGRFFPKMRVQNIPPVYSQMTDQKYRIKFAKKTLNAKITTILVSIFKLLIGIFKY